MRAATARATALLVAASAQTTRAERRRALRLSRLIGDDRGRELLFTLTDEVLRVDDAARAMRRLRALVAEGLPASLDPVDRAGLRLAALGGGMMPALVAAAVRARINAETRGVVLPASDPGFAHHIARRRAEGVESNVNALGEAILGDDEADARTRAVIAYVRRPDVGFVSVKISSLCANLDVLGFEASLVRIVERLRTVYRVAAATVPPTFVYLDMEEYRDLHLTIAAFRTVLDEPEFEHFRAGIALQAYLPDSSAVLDELCEWAGVRHGEGGAPVRVRIVKGANLAMEAVDAELQGWPQAPYTAKDDVDAHYKRMVERAFAAAARGDMHVGVASHNLFDIAWALTARDARNIQDRVEIEMLEGMAPAQARAVRADAGALLLYAPVVDQADFTAAIAYLSRRLDENTGPENFLRALFSITPGSPAWEAEQARFEISVGRRDTVSTRPRRDQDRRTEQRTFDPDAPFENEPDTDFTLGANREWIAHHLGVIRPAPPPPFIANAEEIDARVACAREAASSWEATATADRRAVLSRAAEVMAARRGDAIALMAHETAKTVREGDTEVSEGIDMARWATTQTRALDELADTGVATAPVGTVLVAGPWNFPYAIPANGVLAALAAGNAVLLKPAPESVATAVELVAQLHEAGVPRDVLQLVPCRDDDVGRHLVTHPGVDTVVLTGAYSTAQTFLDWKPQLRLIAETSGKNALVVTGGADIDLAIRDVVRSAFGHAGQKCSAASLLILEAQLYDSGVFLTRLADAVRSIRVGPATDLASMMAPVIAPPSAKLRRALTQLDPGEEWLVEPASLAGSDRMWSPGVKVGVRAGSWFHHTECFGPVLGVMRARDIDHALALQNAPEFGLTAGLHTLDPDEIEHWIERVETGNVYVNRHTTGAIVRRQPFGGWKHSSVGPGAKTGGPHDVLRFVRFHAATLDASLDASALAPRDLAGLRAEQNVLRPRPLHRVLVRVGASTSDVERGVVADAARITGVEYELLDNEDTLARRVAAGGVDRLRVLVPISDRLASACHRAGVTIDDTAVTAASSVELARWTREQAISRTMHRHGRLPA